MRSAELSCVLFVLSGCAMGAPSTDGGVSDSGPDREAGVTDAGVTDAGVTDAGVTDAGVTDAGVTDGGVTDAGVTDAGVADAGGTDGGLDAGLDAGPADGGPGVAITIDGVVGASEWAGTSEATSSTATSWAGNELVRLRSTTRDGRLYLAVEGTIETTNAIVVYVDHQLGDASGLANITNLTDTSGSLDNALSPSSSSPYTTPATFRPDFAWGTRSMSRPAVDFDDGMGWRDLSSPADLAWVSAATAPTICSATACETYIPLTLLGGAAPRTIAMFARIHNGTGDMSPNQTLPMDDPSQPRMVSTLLSVGE